MQRGDQVGGRFRVERLAGSGGMGSVYFGVDTETQSEIAIKVINGTDAETVSRFGREALVLQKLSHPAIVRFVAAGVDGSCPYLVMEWVEGETLADRFRRDPLTIRETTLLGSTLAGALAALHAVGIVHRDLKPRNLILRGDRVEGVVLLDFGIARSYEDMGGPTRLGTMVGSSGYMSPEQASGLERVGPPSDLFALGCVLYECVTGIAPFAGTDPMSIRAKVLLVNPPAPKSLNPQMSDAYSDLIERLLSKEPDKRPSSAEEARAALAALQESETLCPSKSAPPATTLPLPEGAGAPGSLDLMPTRSIAATIGAAQGSGPSVMLLFVGPDPIAESRGDEQWPLEEIEQIKAILGKGPASLFGVVNGWALVVVKGEELETTDEEAVRCSLSLRRRYPERTLTMGSPAGGGENLDQIVASALQLSLECALVPDHPGSKGVFLDESSSRRLEGRFAVARSGAIAYLVV